MSDEDKKRLALLAGNDGQFDGDIPEIVLQTAIVARLRDDFRVSAYVPVHHILDRNKRPNPDPCIIIGEGQSVDEADSIDRKLTRVYLDIHVWNKEDSTKRTKVVAGLIRAAIHSKRLVLSGLFLPPSLEFHCVDCRVSSMRFLRDPDGETSHGIVTIDAKVQEL